MAAMLVLLAVGALAQDGQQLTLEQAVQSALERNPQHAAAAAARSAARARVKESRSFLLPQVTFSETAIRGNDPVYVFGTRLRQQRFTAADFSLDRLNRPTPIADFSARFGGQWRIFDSFANQTGLQQAKLMEAAAGSAVSRADQALIVQVAQAYFGVLLAQRQLAVAEQAQRAADAVSQRAQDRFERGLIVEAELLSARVHQAERAQQLIEARNAVSLAQAELNILLQEPGEQAVAVKGVLQEPALPIPSLAEAESAAFRDRPDLHQFQLQQQAAEKAVSKARKSFGPQLDLFGSWETDTSALFGSGGNNWTGGLELKFDLFSGGAKTARLEQEKARQMQSEADRRIAEDRIRVEVRRSFYQLDSLQQQLAVARGARAQAAESFRVQQNRYESGLTTLTELLRVESELQRTESNYWSTVYRLWLSHVALEFATGRLEPGSPVVKP